MRGYHNFLNCGIFPGISTTIVTNLTENFRIFLTTVCDSLHFYGLSYTGILISYSLVFRVFFLVRSHLNNHFDLLRGQSS